MAISAFRLLQRYVTIDVIGVLHPIGDAVRAEIVEQQHFGIERHAVSLLVGRIGSGVVPGADAVEQVLVVGEEALEALLDDLAQGGHGQVRLAGAGLADEQQAGTRFVGKFADDSS